MKNLDRFQIMMVLIIGFMMGALTTMKSAHADGSMSDAQNRQAKALEDIAVTLKEMNRKVK